MRNNKKVDLWNKLWKHYNLNELEINLNNEKTSNRWKEVKKFIKKKYGSFKDLNVIELGSGIGTYSLLFAIEGSKVSLLDQSYEALMKSKIFFEKYGFEPNIFLHDALDLFDELIGKFDISMSFGLAEHFKGNTRAKIIKSHFDVLKQGGITIISIPNKFCLVYRIWKLILNLMNKWSYGLEYPYSEKELSKISLSLKKIYNFLKYNERFFLLNLSFLNKINPIYNAIIEKLTEKLQKWPFINKILNYSILFIGQNLNSNL